MSLPAQPGSRRRIAAAALLLAAPAVLLYILLTPFASPLPISDDYDAALGFLNRLVQLPGPAARAFWVLTAQHNEYKLWFVNTFVWLQYRCCGLDFRSAALATNLLLLPVAFVLWKLAFPALKDIRLRLLLFLPVSCLWFQLNYVETVDWAVSALQTLPILIAAPLGFLLLARRTPRAFAVSLLCIPAAIGSSGNGFLFAAVGAVFLLRQRRPRAFLLWCAVAALTAALYAIHYVPVHEVSSSSAPVLLRLLARPAFLIVWLGSAAFFKPLTALLGIALCAFWLRPAGRRFLRQNPAIACTMLFILLSGCLVALGRAGAGIWAARTSRYRLYSDLLLIFTWLAIAQQRLLHRSRTAAALLRSPAYRAALITSVVLCLGMDVYGVLYLRRRTHLYRVAMTRYQHPTPGAPPPNPVPREPDSPAHNAWEDHAAQTLQTSGALNVYHPPHL